MASPVEQSPVELPLPHPLRAAAIAAALRLVLAAAAVLALVTFAPGLARAEVVPGEEHCVVNVRADDPLNLRAGPGLGHRVLARLPYGSCGIVPTGECRGNWCRVEDGHHAGFVHARYISMVSPARYCVAGLRSGDGLALRAYPDHGSRVLARLTARTCSIAFLPYAREGWQKVRVDGWEGWVPRANLSGQ